MSKFIIFGVTCCFLICVTWLVEGRSTKDLWITVLASLGLFTIATLYQSLQTVFSATQRIEKRLERIEESIGEVMEKFEQLEDTLAQIDERIPKQTKSYLD